MTDSIADELRRQWAARDRDGEVILESLDEHLPPPNQPAKPNPPAVTQVPVIPRVEPVANVILFPVYSLAPRPVNLASYRPTGK